MHSFRLRLTVALVVCVTLVSVASTYFEVLAHKHLLREDLERRSTWLGSGIQPDFERTVASGSERRPLRRPLSTAGPSSGMMTGRRCRFPPTRNNPRA